MSEIPIHRVRADGSVDRLGTYDHGAKLLRLERAGFPLLGPGEHRVEGDLPWVFWDMCPSGFLGREFHQAFPALRLPPDPGSWSADEVLRALSNAGHNLAGNLLIGEETLLRWHSDRDLAGSSAIRVHDSDEQAWLGGEFPKFAPGQAALFMKNAVFGTRRGELQAAEYLCGMTLRDAGFSVVSMENLRGGGLAIERFDRVPGWSLRARGRRGATTLYWLAAARLGDVNVPAPAVIEDLVRAGHLDATALDAVRIVHAFSAAIGNTDAHLGNYGLVFDDDGKADIAPFYDVLPMALAPRNDELPDAYVGKQPAAADAKVRLMVDALVARVEADPDISPAFKTLWKNILA